MMSADDILFSVEGHMGLIVLNRPKALNALSHDMVRRLSEQLTFWAMDEAIAHVVIKSATERAFSAGGDIRDLYEAGRSGHLPLAFFADEYRLNVMINGFPKPYVALIDGIVMGGGVGVSVNGSHRVGGDKVAFAMPEVGIGFFPDVGGSYFLPRLKGATGTYLALTGGRLQQGDALWAGVLTHAVPSDAFPALEQDLADGRDTDAILARHARDISPGSIAGLSDGLDQWFDQNSLSETFAALEAGAQSGDDRCEAILQTMAGKSPTSLGIAFRQMKDGRQMTFQEVMRMEYRIVSRVLAGHDFYEGVRAAIIDKDQTPRWSPARIDLVAKETIDAYFTKLEEGDLVFKS